MVRFEQVLNRIEEVKDALPFIIEKTQVLDEKVDTLLKDNVLNDDESSDLFKLIQDIREATESLQKS